MSPATANWSDLNAECVRSLGMHQIHVVGCLRCFNGDACPDGDARREDWRRNDWSVSRFLEAAEYAASPARDAGLGVGRS